jgi:hypothetical protein
MNKQAVSAYCCAAGQSTSLTGKHPQPVSCGECGKVYSIEYSPADAGRIQDFERRLLAAQDAVNDDHQMDGFDIKHSPMVQITEA